MKKLLIGTIILLTFVCVVFTWYVIRHGDSIEEAIALHNNNAIANLNIAIERYKKENGLYPKKIEELSPNYFLSIPKDSFGNDFVFYLSPDGAIVLKTAE